MTGWPSWGWQGHSGQTMHQWGVRGKVRDRLHWVSEADLAENGIHIVEGGLTQGVKDRAGWENFPIGWDTRVKAE